ncbi:MAG: Rieske 2Fe-2S domain-containing protein [Halothiobacillaceae bacterium]|nr:MAG: Rieske 2Fe-2S domain-containing protein [Halothiobacillaceae bacterium]
MARILATGIATLDIVNTVDGYPPEDAEVRALSQSVQLGGNAANTLGILAQAGHTSHFAGVLAGDMGGQRIVRELEARGIDLSHARRMAGGAAPTSYIALNRRNGSRTIIHHRDLPELEMDDFMDIPVESFDWLHFEARHCDELAAMLAYARSMVADQPISLEVEKERDGLERLWDAPDIIIFSRAFARGRGFDQPEAFLAEARGWAPKAILVLPWGELGAWAMQGGTILHSPAFPPDEVVDTLGAGDTFNAGLIHAMASGRALGMALEDACRLAGRKVGQHGLDGLFAPLLSGEGEQLCPLASLPDPGSRGFEAEVDGVMRPIFIVRQGREVKGYLNHCPHIGAELNGQPDAFLDGDQRHILCVLHGALFEIGDGRCIAGPCHGEALTPVDIRLERGQVVLMKKPRAGRGS